MSCGLRWPEMGITMSMLWHNLLINLFGFFNGGSPSTRFHYEAILMVIAWQILYISELLICLGLKQLFAYTLQRWMALNGKGLLGGFNRRLFHGLMCTFPCYFAHLSRPFSHMRLLCWKNIPRWGIQAIQNDACPRRMKKCNDKN